MTKMIRLTGHNLGVALVVLAGSAGIAAIFPGSMGAPAIDDNIEAMHADDIRGVSKQAQSGNPLWAISLEDLPATRDRPIFSPSRRSPAPGVATAPDMPLKAEKPVERERPQLLLIGTISGGKDGFGIFLDRPADTVLRLKTGEQHKGWTLREVRSRETVLEKGDNTTTLNLPVPLGAASVRSDEERLR
jgi:general secretion pathway protein N